MFSCGSTAEKRGMPTVHLAALDGYRSLLSLYIMVFHSLCWISPFITPMESYSIAIPWVGMGMIAGAWFVCVLSWSSPLR